jgi:hypothetical protein
VVRNAARALDCQRKSFKISGIVPLSMQVLYCSYAVCSPVDLTVTLHVLGDDAASFFAQTGVLYL